MRRLPMTRRLAAQSYEPGLEANSLSRGTWELVPLMQASVDVPRSAHAPSAGRAGVRGRLGRYVDARELENLELLVSELVTNSLRHAGGDGEDRILIHFAVAPRAIRVEVCDAGPGFEPGEVSADHDAIGGYGLVLVDRVASRWGTSVNGGCCVWFELDRS